MSSRSRVSLLLIAAAALLASACDREERHGRSKPLGETVPAGLGPPTVQPGVARPQPPDPRIAAYENNSPALSEGQTLYTWMNCVGCHSHGGGGMGPALMDDEWRYGGRIDQIAATIAEGRPNGMPAWRDKLTDDQIWKIAAYVHSMSGQARKDAVSSRPDEMSGPTPASLVPRQPSTNSDAAQQ